MKFTLGTMLLVIAAIAVWFGTFTMHGDLSQAGSDVRGVCRVLMFAWAAANAIYLRGSRRAFWVGFVLMLFLYQSANSLKLFDISPLELTCSIIADHLTRNGSQQSDSSGFQSVRETLELFVMLCVSLASGGIFWLVYRRNHKLAA